MNWTPDLKTETGREWARLMAEKRAIPTKPKRAKRFTGDHSQKKAWVRKMEQGPGRFFETRAMPNWLNTRIHWAKKRVITNAQFEEARIWVCAWRTLGADWPGPPPYAVKLTRYGPKLMDDDGNTAALKHFRDGIAKAVGIDDGDTKRIRFRYAQVQTERRGWYGLRIEIKSRKQPAL